jgi:hypothetical protein
MTPKMSTNQQPHNLANGWEGFDFKVALNCPVVVVNDAAAQVW